MDKTYAESLNPEYNLLSGQIKISARSVDSYSLETSEIEIKNLATPIKILIPLKEGFKSLENTHCMFFNV